MNDLCQSLAERHAVVLVEGCDGSGKTTMADQLAGRYGFRVVHSSRSPDSIDLAERHRAIISAPGRLALDRSFVSELVYGPIFHGRSRLTWPQAIELAQLVADRGGLLVHLTAEPQTIQARLRHRRDGDPLPLALIERIQQQYDDVLTQLDPFVTITRHGTDHDG